MSPFERLARCRLLRRSYPRLARLSKHRWGCVAGVQTTMHRKFRDFSIAVALPIIARGVHWVHCGPQVGASRQEYGLRQRAGKEVSAAEGVEGDVGVLRLGGQHKHGEPGCDGVRLSFGRFSTTPSRG
jgi:hypothetical protein